MATGSVTVCVDGTGLDDNEKDGEVGELEEDEDGEDDDAETECEGEDCERERDGEWLDGKRDVGPGPPVLSEWPPHAVVTRATPKSHPLCSHTTSFIALFPPCAYSLVNSHYKIICFLVQGP